MKKVIVIICSILIILMTNIAVAQNCLFVCANDGPRDTENIVIDLLTVWGYNVVTEISSELPFYALDDYAPYDFIFASEAVGSSSLEPLKLIPKPLVNTEGWASRVEALCWSDPNSAINEIPQPVLIVDETNHPLAAGFTLGETVNLVTDPAGWIISTVPTIDIIPIAVLESDPSKSVIYGIETGTVLTDGSVTENRAACVPIHEMGYSSMTDEALLFTQAAINWVTESGSDVAEKVNGNPEGFGLAQNYPNPFNPTTEIQFSILENGYTNLTVYNAMGQIMETLVDEKLNAGDYHITFNAATLPSGVYYYKIQSGSMNQVNKMILMK
ncbi:T9SS type A sorting domain-containing protein [bacterium]